MYKYKIKNNIFYKKGFTLVELMVATSVFMIIMLMAMGSLVTASDSAKKSKALRVSMDNVNFAMENMSRSLRIGTNYTCVTGSNGLDLSSSPAPADCAFATGGGTMVAYIPAREADTVRSAFKLAQRADLSYTLEKCDPTCIDIVSPDVNIDVLKFFVIGSSISDQVQPSVYIIMKGTVDIKGVETSFSMQTLASQRPTE